MDFSTFSKDFNALASLLKPEDEAESLPQEGVSKPTVTPASIGPKDLLNVQVPAPKSRKDPKEIWDEDDLVDHVDDDFDDGRQIPEHEIIMKQSVETTDVFLGMSGKDPASYSCEEMVVRIQLPGVSSMQELELEVKPTYLRLNSPTYKLSMYLPKKVNDEKGKAKWDSAKHVLNVTLPIIYDDDFHF